MLYARAGFGITLADYASPRPVEAAVDKLLNDGKIQPIAVVDEADWVANSPRAIKAVADEMQQKEMKKAFRERTKDLNRLWIKEMVETGNPLREKMALFWHGHFATHIDNPFFDQQLLAILRQNALGNFGSLLVAVSKSAAMLQFLNNRQNKKSIPMKILPAK